MKIRGYTELSIIRSQHVDQGKLNKCILKESVNAVFCMTQ
jgi:hypothetical protein